MSSLTDFGATVEAEHPADQCEAFRGNGERCPYVQESDSKYCPDCSPATALLTFDDFYGAGEVIGRDGRRYRRFDSPTVRNLLRDKYDFTPYEAVVLASGSVLTAVNIIEGRLVGAAIDDADTIPTRADPVTCERARELLGNVRESVTSTDFIEKWRAQCYYVHAGEKRCSYPRETRRLCGYHHECGGAPEDVCIDEFDVPFGPDGGDC
jgi:hypothetical protein